jgi:NAD(P)-dependent dehydrogenase (short-subunit alcohol dehydrogenase family)
MHPAIQAGRVAIITGSASGIGLAAARQFASKGLHVVLADLPTNLPAAAQSITKEFPNVKVLPVETDVSQFSSLELLKKKVQSEFSGKEVGVLMFNPGVGRPSAPFAREGLDQSTLRQNFELMLNTNLWGVINGVQAFLPDLVKQKTPSAVICTGSKQVDRLQPISNCQGITNPPGNPAYNITKTGVKFFTESLAHDLRTNYPESPISVHLLIPGWVYTVNLTC